MPAVGKELEHPMTPEVPVQQPVEQVPYVERVEKQVETQQYVNQQPQSPKPQQEVHLKDMGEIVSAQFGKQEKPKITLPLKKEEVISGLRNPVWKGIRWASEWCVMMINKYPGRVFYLPPESNNE